MTMTDDDTGKIFVGGLSWDTTQEKLKTYFSRYGEVVDCVIMMNNTTGQSRGFGFVKFQDPDVLNVVLAEGPHRLDGKTIDPKGCTPRNQRKKNSNPKLFLGGLPLNATEQDVTQAFSQFGKVTEVSIMFDPEKRKSRGFGFLQFESEEATQQACAQHFVDVCGKQTECKMAVPREQRHPQQQGQSWENQRMPNPQQGQGWPNPGVAPMYPGGWPMVPQQQMSQMAYPPDGNYAAAYEGYAAAQAAAASSYASMYSAPGAAQYNQAYQGGYNAAGQMPPDASSGNYGANAASAPANNAAGGNAYQQDQSQYGNKYSSGNQNNYANAQKQDYHSNNDYGSTGGAQRGYSQQQQNYHPYRR